MELFFELKIEELIKCGNFSNLAHFFYVIVNMHFREDSLWQLECVDGLSHLLLTVFSLIQFVLGLGIKLALGKVKHFIQILLHA